MELGSFQEKDKRITVKSLGREVTLFFETYLEITVFFDFLLSTRTINEKKFKHLTNPYFAGTTPFGWDATLEANMCEQMAIKLISLGVAEFFFLPFETNCVADEFSKWKDGLKWFNDVPLSKPGELSLEVNRRFAHEPVLRIGVL